MTFFTNIVECSEKYCHKPPLLKSEIFIVHANKNVCLLKTWQKNKFSWCGNVDMMPCWGFLAFCLGFLHSPYNKDGKEKVKREENGLCH